MSPSFLNATKRTHVVGVGARLTPMRRRHLTLGQRREYRRMMRLLRQLDRVDAGLSPRGFRARKAARWFVGALSVTLLVTGSGFFLAHNLWGVTLTGDGFRVPGFLGEP